MAMWRALLVQRALRRLHLANKVGLVGTVILVAWEVGIELTADENRVLGI